MSYNWGIDLGGTKIEGVILRDGNVVDVVERLRIPTEGEKGYEHIVKNIKQVADLLSSKSGMTPTKIGICTPGALDPELGVMKNCNSTSLNGKPFKVDIRNALNCKVKISNDANCFAVAEGNLGIVRDRLPKAEVVFGVIMGTGVGGGVVVNGKVINGRHRIGGEWGHNFMDKSGGDCYCGKVGCVETVISGPALERYYYSRSGIKKPLKEIVDSHRMEIDPIATETIDRLIKYFGRGMAYIVNILDPDAIVIGGGVGNIDELYTLGKQEVEKHVFNHKMDTQILKPKLGDSAGVFGAALL